jgi:hypothetical protein
MDYLELILLLAAFAWAEGPITVTDIWDVNAPPTSLAAGVTSYQTAEIGSHDSVFLLFSPKA